ncbi:unnamed protein product [Ophioblennius macclurei]
MASSASAPIKVQSPSGSSSNMCIFMCKGQIGNWKNFFTAEQSQRVDRVLQEKLGDLSLKFVWE